MTDSKPSIIALAERFKKFEVRNSLFDQVLPDGTHYWDIIRFRLYMLVCTKNGIYEHLSTHMIQHTPPLAKRMAKIAFMIPAILKNQIRTAKIRKKRPKYAVQLISRFNDNNGAPVDLLMKDIIDELDGPIFQFETFREAYKTKSQYRKDKYFLYELELMHLMAITKKHDWSYLNKAIKAEFNLDSDWDDFLNTIMTQYTTDHRYYLRLFRKLRPKFLFFQIEPKGMIAAANELNIKTIDQLHGHTNNVDMSYSYPTDVDCTNIPSISKVLLTLGNFWNGIIDFPNKLVNVGNSYFYIEHYPEAAKQNSIMVVSGRFIHEYLADATFGLASNNPELTFYYKLHSNQRSDIEACKIFFRELPNVQVIFTESSVKEIMEHCFAIALIQSSVAYQALQMGLKVFTFKTDYYEASYDIFNEPNFYLFDDWKDLAKALKDNSLRKSEKKSTVFFEQFHPLVFQQLLKYDDDYPTAGTETI